MFLLAFCVIWFILIDISSGFFLVFLLAFGGFGGLEVCFIGLMRREMVSWGFLGILEDFGLVGGL